MRIDAMLSEKHPKTILWKYYNETLTTDESRKRFIKTLMERTGVSHTTIYRWINGVSKIRKSDANIVSELTQIPVSTLFPYLSTEFIPQTAS